MEQRITPVVMNDPDPDGTPHWKYRLHWAGIWQAEDFPTRERAEQARERELRRVMRQER